MLIKTHLQDMFMSVYTLFLDKSENLGCYLQEDNQLGRPESISWDTLWKAKYKTVVFKEVNEVYKKILEFLFILTFILK